MCSFLPPETPGHYVPPADQPSLGPGVGLPQGSDRTSALLVHLHLRLPLQKRHTSQAHVDVINALIEKVPCPFGHLKHKAEA